MNRPNPMISLGSKLRFHSAQKLYLSPMSYGNTPQYCFAIINSLFNIAHALKFFKLEFVVRIFLYKTSRQILKIVLKEPPLGTNIRNPLL